MKIVHVRRYACEFCSYRRANKRVVVDHEKFCFANPARSCRICDQFERENPSAETLDAAYKLGFDELEQAAKSCPDCMLSVIVREDDFDHRREFDYAERRANALKDLENFRREKYGDDLEF